MFFDYLHYNEVLNLINAERRLLNEKAALIVQKQGEVDTGYRMCLREKHSGVVQRQGRALLAIYGKVEGQNLLKSVARSKPDKDGPRAASAVGAADVNGVIQRVGFPGIQVY